MRIGFIGIGIMGESMARHLMEHGHALTVFNRTRAKAEGLIAQGAAWAENVGACAREQEAIMTMVGFPKDVREVYLGAGGILDNAPKGALLIDMTTTSPKLWQDIAGEARKRGLRPLDAPVSGGDTGARNASLSIMAGGAKEDFDAALPLFQCMGKNIVWTGEAGCGQHTKMANQIALAGALAGVAEAIRYGEVCGLDTENMLACLSAGAAGSWQMTHNGPKMIAGDDAPGFLIKHFIKDMKIAEEESQRRECELPVLEQTLSMYEYLKEQGRGESGTQALIDWYR